MFYYKYHTYQSPISTRTSKFVLLEFRLATQRGYKTIDAVYPAEIGEERDIGKIM